MYNRGGGRGARQRPSYGTRNRRASNPEPGALNLSVGQAPVGDDGPKSARLPEVEGRFKSSATNNNVQPSNNSQNQQQRQRQKQPQEQQGPNQRQRRSTITYPQPPRHRQPRMSEGGNQQQRTLRNNKSTEGLPTPLFGQTKMNLASNIIFPKPEGQNGTPSLSMERNAGVEQSGSVNVNRTMETLGKHMETFEKELLARNFVFSCQSELHGHESLADESSGARESYSSPRENITVQQSQKVADKPAKDDKKLSKKQKKLMEKNRKIAEQERKWMNEEEWRMERANWWGQTVRDGSWRTVRVFISSTFNDMHGERDALTRVVFPAVNNRAKNRRVRVVPVDLRWGLTSEDTSDSGLGALEHCLLEIDNSRPFFIVLRGERYGWIPPNYRVSDR